VKVKILYRLIDSLMPGHVHINVSHRYRTDYLFTSNEIIFRVICVAARRRTCFITFRPIWRALMLAVSLSVECENARFRWDAYRPRCRIMCVSNRERCYCFRRAQLGKKNKQCEQQTQIPDAVSAAASNNSDSRNFRLKTLRLQLNMNPSTLNLRYIR